MASCCPTKVEFEELLKGTLPPTDSAAIDQHLLQCAACRQRLNALAGNNESWLKAKQTSPIDPISSPPLREVINRLKVEDQTPVAQGMRLRYLGDYELLEELGRGGMGIVYRARQLSLQREVAVKVILAGQLASAADVRRFHVEAEAAAKLDHPHIVPIFEIGEQEGHHFFSMKLVEGGSLAERSSEFRVPGFEPDGALSNTELKTRSTKLAALVATIARAVHYAHQRGVLHRDLKPGNILIDRDGQPHLTDFGLAKILEHDSDLTHSAAIMGTANYIAPEVAAGKAKEVTTAADVFSLGAILYELLTGRTPFAENTPLATMRAAMEQEPKRPSAWNRRVDRDLETICLKCLEKDPSRRFTSARALAEDLERWLNHEPILARRSGATERAAKWARRHPASAGLLAACLVAPSILAGVLVVSSSRINRERNRAVAHERIARKAQSDAETEKQRAEESEQTQRAHAYAADIYAAFQALEKDNFAYAVETVERYFSAPSRRDDAVAKDLLGFEWRLLWQRTRGDFAAAVTNPISPAICLLFHPNDGTLLAGSELGVDMWKMPEGKWMGKFLRPNDSSATNQIGRVKSMLFIGRGQRLLIADDDRVTCWSYPTAVFQFAWREQFAELALAGDEKTIAVGVWNNARDGLAQSDHPYSVVLYDAETRAAKNVLPGYGHKIAISPNGQWVLTGSRSNGVVLWHPETDARTKIKRDHGSGGMSFSPDSKLLAVGGWQKSIHALEVDPLLLRASFTGYQLGADVLAWMPDGTNLLSVGLDQTIKLWSVPLARTNVLGANVLPDRPDVPPRRTLFGHTVPATTLAVSHDGKWMASASLDRRVLIWDLQRLSPDEKRLVLPAGRNRHLEPVSGCIVAYSNTALVVWNPLIPNTPARVLPDTENMLFVGSLTGISRFAALHTGNRRVSARLEIRDLPDGEVRSRIELPELGRLIMTTNSNSITATISPDGRWLAVTRDASNYLYNLSERRWCAAFHELIHASNGMVQKILFSPDSRLLVVAQNAANDSSFTVVEVASCRAEQFVRLAGEPESATAVIMHPGSRYLATGGLRQNSIRIWDLRTGRLAGRCNGNIAQGGMVWSPDGQTLATHGHLGLQLWSMCFYRELATLEHRSGFIPCGFTADGRSLISCSGSGLVRRDTAPALEQIFETRHP